MTLRLKLLLAQAPLAVALVAVGLLAVATTSSLGKHSQEILKDNYRSVLAAQRMKDSIERMQDVAALVLIGDQGRNAMDQITGPRQVFESELRVQEGNITEPGEAQATQHLRERWMSYQEKFNKLAAGTVDPRRFFFDELEPDFVAVREAADAILAMNQDAMVHKSERARQEAERTNAAMILAAVSAVLIGILTSTTLTTRLLRPLALLTQTVNRIGEGDFDARITLPGRDELTQLAGQVNAMAARLSQYRRSSLGDLLLAQQASQAAIDSLPDPVVVFDVRGDVLNVNRAAETLLGVGLGPAASDPWQAVESAVAAVIEQVRTHVLSGRGSYVPKGFEEAVHISSPEGERDFLPRATPVYAEQGGIAGATVVLQDVTRLRRVDELRNDLVATVAHEFRTPLTSLRMAIHLCIEQTAGPLTEKQADLLYAARDDCDRLQAMVDDLLDLSRIQAGKIELHAQPLPVTELVQWAVDTYRGAAEERGLRLSARDPVVKRDVLVDPERIRLVFANLVTNAIRHTRDGEIALHTATANGQVRIAISDTGEGIPPEYQKRIFDKFFRGPGHRSEGAGLGLSIAKEIVTAHGGEIGVDSQPGHGSTFWFTLPVAPPTRKE